MRPGSCGIRAARRLGRILGRPARDGRVRPWPPASLSRAGQPGFIRTKTADSSCRSPVDLLWRVDASPPRAEARSVARTGPVMSGWGWDAAGRAPWACRPSRGGGWMGPLASPSGSDAACRAHLHAEVVRREVEGAAGVATSVGCGESGPMGVPAPAGREVEGPLVSPPRGMRDAVLMGVPAAAGSRVEGQDVSNLAGCVRTGHRAPCSGPRCRNGVRLRHPRPIDVPGDATADGVRPRV